LLNYTLWLLNATFAAKEKPLVNLVPINMGESGPDGLPKRQESGNQIFKIIQLMARK
jgi:hypothetical protein